MKNFDIYSDFAEMHHLPNKISLEELEEIIEQKAREEEADSIVLAEEKRMQE